MSVTIQTFIAVLFGWWLAGRETKKRRERLERNLCRINNQQEGL
jgi:hypothetical protein